MAMTKAAFKKNKNFKEVENELTVGVSLIELGNFNIKLLSGFKFSFTSALLYMFNTDVKFLDKFFVTNLLFVH